MKKIILLLLLCALPLIGIVVETRAENGWSTNPERTKIRTIVEEVAKLEGAKSLQQKSKQCRYGSEKFDDIGATIHTDAKGLVRKYVVDRENWGQNTVSTNIPIALIT